MNSNVDGHMEKTKVHRDQQVAAMSTNSVVGYSTPNVPHLHDTEFGPSTIPPRDSGVKLRNLDLVF